MATTSRTFRIFVSSTFSDLAAERNALQQDVFPRLRQLCEAHACRFQAIDLRWGVSEEAALDQQTMKICLAEIQRCQQISPRPNFIILLGDRYGWRPLPYEIPANEYERLYDFLSPDDRRLVEEWYRRDENAAPAVYVLQPRSSTYAEYANWEAVERRLQGALEVASQAARLPEAALLKYSASATEQEIVAGALQAAEAGEHVFCFRRVITNLPNEASAHAFSDFSPSGQPDLAAMEQQAQLRKRLKECLQVNYLEYLATWTDGKPSLAHIENLCQDVYARLEKVILAEIARLQEINPLDEEIAAHAAFRDSRSKNFSGRSELLDKIAGYISGPSKAPLVVWGSSGSGKSALLAKASQRASEMQPEAVVLYRFIGVTPNASNGRLLLNFLCRQIETSVGHDPRTVPGDYKTLSQKFPRYLASATPKKRLIIFLDGLDQLPANDSARSLKWLPSSLPPNVKLVVSTLPGELLAAMEVKSPLENRLEVVDMPVAEGAEALELYLKEAGRRLQPAQRGHILDCFRRCGLPLYLKLAFEEARRWKSWETPPDLPVDIPGMIRYMLGRLSAEANHGWVLVERSLGYLGAAKNGLSEDELLDVLSRDPQVIADFLRRSPHSPKVERLPVVVWSRLYGDLEPYLSTRRADGSLLLTFYHRQLGEVTAADYLPPTLRQELSRRLAAYFQAQALATQDSPNLRKLSEQAYQQAVAQESLALRDTLADFDFLLARLRYFGRTVIEDYDLTELLAGEAQLSDEDLHGFQLIQRLLQLTVPFLALDASQLPGQLLARLMDDPTPVVQRLLEGARAYRGGAWLRPLNPCLAHPGGFLRNRLDLKEEHVTGLAADPDNRHMIVATFKAGEEDEYRLGRFDVKDSTWEYILKTRHTSDIERLAVAKERFLSAAASTLKVWNLQDGRFLYNFDQHEAEITALAVAPDGRRVISVDDAGSLILWDTETGQALAKGYASGFSGMAFLPGGEQFLAVNGGYLSRYSLDNLERGQSIDASPGSATSETISITPDGKLAVVVWDGHPVVWDIGAEKILTTYHGHPDYVHQAAALPDNQHAISCSEDHTLHIWRLWDGQTVRVLRGHEEMVTCLAVSPDGSLAASGGWAEWSEKLTFCVWDLNASPPERRFEGHQHPVDTLLVTPDGSQAISKAEGEPYRVWHIASGRASYDLEGEAPENHAECLLKDGSHLAAILERRWLQIWELNQGRSLTRWELPADPLEPPIKAYWSQIESLGRPNGEELVLLSGYTSADQPSGERKVSICQLWNIERQELRLAFQAYAWEKSGDGRYLALVTPQESVQLIELATLQARDWEGLGGRADCLAFSQDHTKLAVAAYPTGIQVWELASRRLICCVGDYGVWQKMAFIDQGQKLVAYGRHLMGWKIPSGEVIDDLAPLFYLELYPDRFLVPESEKRLVCCGQTTYASDIQIIDLETGRVLLKNLNCALEMAGQTRLLPGDRYGLSIGMDWNLQIWDHEVGKLATAYHADCAITASDVDASGRVFACGDQQGGVHFLKLEEGGRQEKKLAPVAQPVKTPRAWDAWVRLHGHYTDVTSLAYSRDGSRLASASLDATLRVWDMVSLRTEKVLSAGPKANYAVRFSPDGTRLVSVDGNEARVWNTNSGTLLHTLSGHTNFSLACAFSPDGRWILTAAWDKTLRIWDAATGELAHILKGHTERVEACAFSPDGRLVLSSSYDRSMRVWEAAGGQPVRILSGLYGGHACSFSRDGRFLLGSTGWFTLVVIEAATGDLLQTIKGHTGEIHACEFSPDGRFIVSASEDKTLRIWETGGGKQVASYPFPGPLRSMCLHPSLPRAVCGDKTGAMYVVELPVLSGNPSL